MPTRTELVKQQRNGKNLSSVGVRNQRREEDCRLVQHRRADEEHDSETAQGEDSREDSRDSRFASGLYLLFLKD